MRPRARRPDKGRLPAIIRMRRKKRTQEKPQKTRSAPTPYLKYPPNGTPRSALEALRDRRETPEDLEILRVAAACWLKDGSARISLRARGRPRANSLQQAERYIAIAIMVDAERRQCGTLQAAYDQVAARIKRSAKTVENYWKAAPELRRCARTLNDALEHTRARGLI
jgi:hypothetical protein